MKPGWPRRPLDDDGQLDAAVEFGPVTVAAAETLPTVGSRFAVDVRTRLRRAPFWGGAASVAVAMFLLSRIGIDGRLYRDDAIYAYGGQQLTHGVAPYASIFDPKGPLSTFIGGLAAWFAHGIGVADLTMMRLTFFAICVLTALAVYLLVLQIWHSVLGGVTAAVVFASFQGYAQDALRGPDAHTAGPLWAVLAMWLALRRQWYWAAFAGALATLVKQTYLFYALVAILAAVVYDRERRRRALLQSVAGALTPFVLTFGYFVAKGAVGTFWESAVRFPVVGLHRAKEQTIYGNVRRIAGALHNQYGFSGVLFGVGLVLLVAVAVAAVVRAGANWRAALLAPQVVVVGLTGLTQAAYLLRDFISYDDLYQLLPYAAAGFGAVASLAVQRAGTAHTQRVLAAGIATALAGLTALSCVLFLRSPYNDHALPKQRAMGCALNRIVPAGSHLFAIGDPVPLVLTGARNPDRYIYLYSGVAPWKVKHTVGGMAGWVRQVTSPNNSVVVFQKWDGGLAEPLLDGIVRAGYRGGFLGKWRVFLDTPARVRAHEVGLRVTQRPSQWPLTTSGARFTVQNCGVG
jgi:hypothetical protein